MIENNRVNNPINWMSNQNSPIVFLKPIENSHKLRSRLINFCYVSNFIVELIDNFFLFIIVETLEPLIVLVIIIEVISYVV